MLAYKGFNKDLTCTLGSGTYQYEVGKTFKTTRAKCVSTGLHCAEYPPDCFSYYPMGNGNRYFLVEAGGHIDEDSHDSKIACTEMTLLEELSIQDMMYATVAYIFAHPQREFKHKSSGIIVNPDEAVLDKDGGFCIAVGKNPRVISKVDEGIMVLLTQNDDGEIAGAKLLKIGVNGVEKDTWYTNAKEWAKKVVKPSMNKIEAKYEKENDRESAL